MGHEALRVAREKMIGLDPSEAASRVGAHWDGDRLEIELPFLGSIAILTYPAYEVLLGADPAPPHVAALIVYHVALSDGLPPSGTWIDFADLPDASFYSTAFRGYTSTVIARRFGPRGEGLDEAVGRVGGEMLSGLADRAWHIPALPRVPVALLWWSADDEFEARAGLLFDSTAPHHLTTDGCAVLGSWLTTLLIRSAETPK